MSERRGTLLGRLGLVGGPAAFLALALLDHELHHLPGVGSRPAYAAAVSVWMAIWWFTEAVPIHWTACLPLLLFPPLGVFGRGLGGDAVRAAEPYADAYIFLFLGGMVLGAAMEHWSLHRRIALHIMCRIGTEPRRLLLGILVATAVVSAWISNTATAVMMMPIGMALLAQLERDLGGRRLAAFGTAVMLGIAYAANVGGVATKIGTATNSIFAGFVSDKLGRDLGFLEYAAVGVPFVILFLPVVWLVLWQLARQDDLGAARGREVIERELASLGAMAGGERVVAAVFGAAAALWILADPLKGLLAPLAASAGFRLQGKHLEAGVSMAAALALVGGRFVPLAALRRVPWGTLVLLGGSFAMAAGIEGSGLSGWLGGKLAFVAELEPVPQLLVVTSSTIALSAVASNTATVNLLLNLLPRSVPLLAATAIASSCDFALPAGTPPNAIVFGSGYIRLPTMMKVGGVLDVLAALAVALYAWLWVGRVL